MVECKNQSLTKQYHNLLPHLEANLMSNVKTEAIDRDKTGITKSTKAPDLCTKAASADSVTADTVAFTFFSDYNTSLPNAVTGHIEILQSQASTGEKAGYICEADRE